MEFEVLENTFGEAGKAAGVRAVGAKFVDDYYKNGGTGSYTAGHTILCYYENGKPKIPVGRVLIRRRAVPFKFITDLNSPPCNEKRIFTKIVIKRLDNGEPPA